MNLAKIAIWLMSFGPGALLLGCEGAPVDAGESTAADGAVGGATADLPRLPKQRGTEGPSPSRDRDRSMGGASAWEPNEPPTPTQGGGACILSADCDVGTYCDLGECVQACSSQEPCASGLYCSLRGRCLADGEEDRDPSPVMESQGSLRVDPVSVQLTEADDRLRLTISSSSRETVRYRIVSNGPHLSVEEPRGEFRESTVVEVSVNTDELRGRHVPGTLRILTNLGDLSVNAPVRVGVSGSYEGALEYFVGDVPLGKAQIVLDILEEKGDVRVRVDPTKSLVFPSLGSDPDAPDGLLAAYGRGFFNLSDGVDVTIRSLVPSVMGGERNHFKRPIGRELSLKVRPDEDGRGILRGDFSERLVGLFEQPVSVHGKVVLRTRSTPRRPEYFRPPQQLEMPGETSGFSSEPFQPLLERMDSVRLLPALAKECGTSPPTTACLSQQSAYFSSGLRTAFSQTIQVTTSLEELRDECEKEMYSHYTKWSESKQKCSNIAGLVSILLALDSYSSPLSKNGAPLFHATVSRLLAAPLLIAQDDIVSAARESFLTGLSNQRELYENAREVLSAPTQFVMQPWVLEFLRRTPAEQAEGTSDEGDSSTSDYPAFRALSRLLYVLATIEGELGQLAAGNPSSDLPQERRKVQENAVLTVLEATALAALLEDLTPVPPGMGTELAGALTPLDRGFSTLQYGAVLFGVPEGEIPLAFDPARPESTNFEQILLDRAQPSIALEAASETDFLEAKKTFDENRANLEAELERLRAGYDETVLTICGADFDFSLAADDDWETCGENDGSLASARLDLEHRHAEIQSAYTRLEGMGLAIELDKQAIMQKQRVRTETLWVIERAGGERESITKTENLINAAQVALDLASNSSLWNAGASAALGVASAVLELSKSEFQVRRVQLETLQTMRFSEEAKELELIDAMTSIKKQLIDMYQLEIDMEQSNIALLESSMSAQNLLVSAQRAFQERSRALSRVERSPLSDPIYRTLMHSSLMSALSLRREAQRSLYLAGRALEYEINTPLGDLLGRAVLGAHNETAIAGLTSCLQSIFSEHALAYGVPQEFKTTVSVRKMLGIEAPRIDEITGEVLSEGELFRRILLQNEHFDVNGGVALEFSTNLEPGNSLWSSNVCNDKIVGVRAQLVGDFLGDDEAEVNLSIAGGGVLRDCGGDSLQTWDIAGAAPAVVQAGVNSFGTAKVSSSLYGQSVARPNWRLAIPSGYTAPSNLDLDLSKLEDVVLEVTHRALPVAEHSDGVSLRCLSHIGSGG